MTEFFDWMSEILTSLYEIIQHFFVSLIRFIEIIIGAVSSWYSALGMIPNWLRIYATATVTVCVIYLLIGRESGK